MAKRRKLTAPSAEHLDKIEQEFRRETSPNPGMAPIAQVAAENAMNVNVVDAGTRARLAELERYRAAEQRGLVARMIDIDAIDPNAVTRDRMDLDPQEFAELKAAILANGLRMPIEVFELEPQEGRARYGLISGYRRFRAVRELRGQPGQAPGLIEALVRPPATAAGSMEAMVEENEIRSNLSQFERGRIAVLAVQSGVYGSVEEATLRLFAFASKAKRSKIRSFALVFEQLGDVLNFPQLLSEKQGLALATALRNGAGDLLRESLAQLAPADATQEWAAIQRCLSGFAAKPAPDAISKGGRPKAAVEAYETAGGVTITVTRNAKGVLVQLDGAVSDGDIGVLVDFVKNRL